VKLSAASIPSFRKRESWGSLSCCDVGKAGPAPSRQWEPAQVFVVDCNDDNVILRFGNAEQRPIGWPLREVTLETDVQGRLTIVLHGHGR
jgi:hypothetical protein